MVFNDVLTTDAAPKPAGAAAGFAFALLVTAALPLGLGSQIDAGSADATSIFAQYLVVFYSGLRLTSLFIRGVADWLSIVIFGFSYVWLAVAPLIQAIAGLNPLGVVQSAETMAVQALVVLAGLLAYDIGLLASRGTRSSSVRAHRRELSPRRVVIMSVLCLAAAPVLIQVMGGVETLFSSRIERLDVLQDAGLYSETSKSQGAWVSAISSVLPFVALYGLVSVGVIYRQYRRRPAYWLLLVSVVAANVLLNNPISSSRFWVLVVLLSLVFVAQFARRPVGVRWIVGGFALAGLVVFPYLDFFRTPDAVFRIDSVTSFILDKTDYDAMTQVGNSIEYSSSQGSTLGYQSLGALLFWVPRQIWPSKPIDTGSLLAQSIGYPNANLSAPLWGELYIDFGVIGVLAAFFAVGAAVGPVSRRYVRSFARDDILTATQFVYPVLCLYAVLLLRGSLLQAMGRLVVLIVILFLCTRRAGERRSISTPDLEVSNA